MAEAESDQLASTSTLQSLSTSHETLADEEIALYDRKIRLWGVQAQEK